MFNPPRFFSKIPFPICVKTNLPSHNLHTLVANRGFFRHFLAKKSFFLMAEEIVFEPFLQGDIKKNDW